MNKLELKNLSITINNNLILHSINLSIKKGETILILGPNGHGKSTLFKALLRHYSTNIKEGQILIDNECVNEFSTNQIANKGLYLASQHPIEIPGLKTFDLLRNELGLTKKEIKVFDLYKNINTKLKDLNLSEEILKRNINENFSGGERKKAEILQMQVLNPDFILLDEIDSGLDTDALNKIIQILKKEKEKQKAIIYISHNDKLSHEIIPDKVLLMVNGTIIKEGDYSLAKKINEHGYSWIEKELNITIKKDDIDLLDQSVGYFCNAK